MSDTTINTQMSLEEKYRELMDGYNIPIQHNSSEDLYKQFSLYDSSIYDTQASSNVK